MVVCEYFIDFVFNLDFDVCVDVFIEDECWDVFLVRIWFFCSCDLRCYVMFFMESVVWWYYLCGEVLNLGVFFFSEWIVKNIKGLGMGW